MLLSGAEIVVECLKEQGVDTVFGYPGGAILNIYDALYKQSDIKHYLTSHEQGASHAADGYARATGRTGVCFATSGPGATNIVTGIATAYMDSVPVVAITCNVTTDLLGKDSFQEIDIAGITMPVTKHNFIVKDVSRLADTIRKAFRIAQTGRKGPVLIDITKDVTANKYEYEFTKPELIKRKTALIDEAEVDSVIELIKLSQKPFILVGGGVIRSGASGELRSFAKKLDAPVADTLMGKGAFPGNSDSYTGMVGMHGTKTSNFGITESDLLIAIGTRFSDRVLGNVNTFARHADIVHIDVDAAEIDKNVEVNHQIIGDAKVVLQMLCDKLEDQHHPEWMAHIREMKSRYPLVYDKDVLTGPGIVETVYEMTNGRATICAEVGQHQMWAAQFYKYSEPGQFITSGGLGTMGFGIGASMGIKLGCPDKTVINMAGDGCFRMNMNELATAGRYCIPFIEIIFNNHVLGMVHQWQGLFYGKRYSSTIIDDKVDFVKVSEGLGVKARSASTPEEFREAFAWALTLDEPVVINCEIDPEENVWPMVPPGASISDAFNKQDLEKKNILE
ncbi:MAG: biosynthetic-type acetolactate synthase large subunit [Lachnospiraceae bacterium]|nr:biosynthetic-type acetolactate synthase large subunit [Lachnospiraceae bacterium]